MNKAAVWQVTTFETLLGKYRYLRTPYAIQPAAEIFQRKMPETLDGLNDVACIEDYVLIYGCGDKAKEARRHHGRNLVQLLERCRQRNIRLNKDMTKLNRDSVRCMGHARTKSGLKPDSRKVEAIVKTPPPSDRDGVVRLIDMATFWHKIRLDLRMCRHPSVSC